MATPGEYGWQLEKTLTECMRHMLDKEISTDVCFKVGPPDGQTVMFRAHKYMLMARSPVFEAMFSSGMTECSEPEAKVRIEDIDADAFKEVLNYIYSDSISVCTDSAVQLMYAAKKYMLSKLVGECRKYFWEILNVHNVIDILGHSLFFDDQLLKSDCLKLIAVNAKAVFTGAEILSASPQVMDTILEMKIIPVNELVIYEATINWAKHQLHNTTPGENLADLRIREELGDLLYKIHFPVMKPAEFAEITAGNNLLTAEEKAAIYHFSLTKNKDHHLRFPTERRMSEESWIDRDVIRTAAVCDSVPCLDAIDFKTNQDVLLTGIGLYAAENETGYDVDVEILQSVNSVFKKSIKVPHCAHSNLFKIVVKEPIAILAGLLYSVKTVSCGHIRHYGHQCHAKCTNETVTFKFTKHSHSPTTCETLGQIPRLYFCFL